MVQGIRTIALASAVDSENPTIGDLKLVNGDFVWLTADDPEATAQAIARRLGTYKGEWFLDQKEGFPWFQSVLGNGRSPARIKALMRRAISSTPGVRSCTLVSYELDRQLRELSVEWKAFFDDGKIYASSDFDVAYIVEVS